MNNYNEKAEQNLLEMKITYSNWNYSFIIGVSFAIRIEQVAGYYECQNAIINISQHIQVFYGLCT